MYTSNTAYSETVYKWCYFYVRKSGNNAAINYSQSNNDDGADIFLLNFNSSFGAS